MFAPLCSPPPPAAPQTLFSPPQNIKYCTKLPAFQPFSILQRLLTHRTAQHWGLETSTIAQGEDQGRIVATRTPAAGPPPVKLANLPVVMEEPAAAATQGPAPRVLVRKRNERGGQRHGGGGHGGGYGGPEGMAPYGGHPGGTGYRPGPGQPLEDRELHYELTRARIFGDGGNGSGGGGGGNYPAPHHQQQGHMMPMPYGMGLAPMPRGMPAGPGGYMGGGGGRGRGGRAFF